MQWNVQNSGKDPIIFQLALSPFVKVPGPIEDGATTLTRGTNTLTMLGFDSMTNTLTGTLLICQVKSGTTRSITMH